MLRRRSILGCLPHDQLAGVLAERGKRSGGHADPVVHWLLFGHVEQFDFCRLLIW